MEDAKAGQKVTGLLVRKPEESRFADDEDGCQGSVTRVYMDINMATIKLGGVCVTTDIKSEPVCLLSIQIGNGSVHN